MDDNYDDTVSSDDLEPEQSMTEKMKQLAIPVGIAAVIVIAVLLIVIRRKKKKAGMDDEIL